MHDTDLLSDLNPEQRQAVTHGEGPLMIVAGAGTGKTTVITRRIAWLIMTSRARADEILALTFTEKASTEMEERVDRLLPMGYVDLSISTFHAFCEKVLRLHGLHIGLSPDFKIATDTDSWLLMRRHLDRFKLDYFRPRGNPTRFLRTLLQHFSRAKDEGITPEHYSEWVTGQVAELSGGAPEAFAAMSDETKLDLKKWQELAGAYATYEQLLVDKSLLDFGSLLAYVLRLFSDRPNILREYQNRYKYLVVDEFQDTNTIQYQLVKLLANPARNITVVGDDDQAIYKFRGAALANILSFRHDFNEATRVVLTNNYRSGQVILDSAYRLIQQNNPHRLEATEGLSKSLVAHKEIEAFIKPLHAGHLDGEVDMTVQEIIRLQAGTQSPWSEFCILVRANDAAEPFLEALERAGVPYRFMARSGLYGQPIVLDTLAYMRLARLPADGPAAYRVLSHPRLGLSSHDLSALLMYAKQKGVSLTTAMQASAQVTQVSSTAQVSQLEILGRMDDIREKSKRVPVTELFIYILKHTGLLGDVSGLPEAEQQEVFRQLEGFLSRLKRFVAVNEEKGLISFLDEFEAEREAGESGALPTDEQAGPDVVNVMTVHAAKGLEFSYVFVVNLIEQRFPSVSRSEGLPLPPGLMGHQAELDDHIAEERRLFYVAMTRAKVGLYLCSADDYGGIRKRKPSRFLAELGMSASVACADQRDSLLVSSHPTPEPPILSYTVPERISFSQIAAFTTCPLQYKYAHILHVPTFGRQSFSFGKSMHNTLQKFLQALVDQQSLIQATLFTEGPTTPASIPGLDVLLQLYTANFIDEWYTSLEEREEYREQGVSSLKVFHQQLLATAPKIYALEHPFTLKLGDVLVKGRIDRIDEAEDGGFEIIDYKTGQPKSKLSFDDKRQLILYALALERCLPDPRPISKLTYYYLTTNQTLSFVPTDSDREKLIAQVADSMVKIASSDFAGDPDPMKCRYCDFKDICPVAKL